MRLGRHGSRHIALTMSLFLSTRTAAAPAPFESFELLREFPSIGWAVEPSEPPAGMFGKGGKQNIDNEFVSEARKHADPCAWLAERYTHEKSPANKLKLVAAQKALGCRNKQKRQDS